MLEKFLKLIIRWCERHGRVLDITGTGGSTDLYLRRYYVFKSRWFNIFIHRFFRSDRDDLHDHPWNFATYLVKGSYTERKWNPRTYEIDETERMNIKKPCAVCGYTRRSCGTKKQNRLVFRKAEDQHQVVLLHSLTEAQREDATLTICVTGRTRREWGFIRIEPLTGAERLMAGIEWDMFVGKGEPPKTKRVWVNWKKYLGLPPDEPGRG